MGHFKSIFMLLLFLSLFAVIKAQDRPEAFIICAKVVGTDNKEILDSAFQNKMRLGERKYYFGLLHVIGVNPTGDTINMAVVFDLKKQYSEAYSGFGIKRDSVYRFDVARFAPCNSDFPGLIGCKYDSIAKQSVYVPNVLSVVRKEYKYIFRVLDFTKLSKELWEEIIH